MRFVSSFGVKVKTENPVCLNFLLMQGNQKLRFNDSSLRCVLDLLACC